MRNADMFSLQGKTAVITGGERGIGFEIGLCFAEAGANIVIAGIREELFAPASEKIEAQGVRCLCVPTDVSDEAAVQSMVRQAQNAFPTLDVLVNNAGMNAPAPAESMSLRDWRRVLDVNLTGVFLVSREVGGVMLGQGSGSIINIASMSGLIVNTPQTQCNYNTSKAGVIMLTKSMAAEWATRGVRVNAIAPGYMRTPLTEGRFQNPADPTVEKWMSMTPMHRVGVPTELTGLALYYASAASTYTTGAVMPVDGGYTAW